MKKQEIADRVSEGISFPSEGEISRLREQIEASRHRNMELAYDVGLAQDKQIEAEKKAARLEARNFELEHWFSKSSQSPCQREALEFSVQLKIEKLEKDLEEMKGAYESLENSHKRVIERARYYYEAYHQFVKRISEALDEESDFGN